MNPSSPAHKQGQLVIERTYGATLEAVWELWTTKEGFESWWGPRGFRAEVKRIEAHEGGALQYEMIADTPEMIAAMKEMGRPASHPTSARFTEVKPRQRLVITNVIDFLPNVATYESNITVEFFAVRDGVRMQVTLDAMHSDEFSNMQKEGFSSQLTKLDELFS